MPQFFLPLLQHGLVEIREMTVTSLTLHYRELAHDVLKLCVSTMEALPMESQLAASKVDPLIPLIQFEQG